MLTVKKHKTLRLADPLGRQMLGQAADVQLKLLGCFDTTKNESARKGSGKHVNECRLVFATGFGLLQGRCTHLHNDGRWSEEGLAVTSTVVVQETPAAEGLVQRHLQKTSLSSVQRAEADKILEPASTALTLSATCRELELYKGHKGPKGFQARPVHQQQIHHMTGIVTFFGHHCNRQVKLNQSSLVTSCKRKGEETERGKLAVLVTSTAGGYAIPA